MKIYYSCHVEKVLNMNYPFLFISWIFVATFQSILRSSNAQQILLESTIVRCNQEEMLEDGTPKHPLQLASSNKGSSNLDLKVYSKCRKKLQITLRITESSANFVPNAVILIDMAKNALTEKSSRFGRPIAVKFHQETLFQKYALKYMFRVNGKMWEEVINSENTKNYTGCKTGSNPSQPSTCGYISRDGSKQNAGFCCSCQEHRNNVQQRGGQRCDTPHKTPSQLTSAHCLRPSAYWYNVYEMLPPSLYQRVTFEVFKSQEHKNGSIYWERMSGSGKGVEVNSDEPINADGTMKVIYRPHVEGVSRSVMTFDSQSQRLLFPLPNPYSGTPESPDPEPLNGTIDSQILVVPKTLMSPHGASCNHVGTNIEAFVNQPEACRQERNACLLNQPFDLWKQDQGFRGDPKFKFRLQSYLTENQPPIVDFSGDYKTGSIYVEHKADAPTYVDIEIPADDVIILSPGYNAFIESVVSDTGSEGAKVVTQVVNKELVAATFTVELVQCSLNFSQGDDMELNVEMKSKPQKIGPLNANTFYLDLHSYAIKLPIDCYVVLVNEYGESIAAREVTLKPFETCLCVHTCQCACGDTTNVKCVKMSDDNIIATGLISAIKTAEQTKEEESLHFTQKYRWIFHWILVFHLLLLAIAFFGWIQRKCKKRTEEPSNRKLMDQTYYEKVENDENDDDDDNEDLNSTSSSEGSEVTLFEKASADVKQLESVTDLKSTTTDNVDKQRSEQTNPKMSTVKPGESVKSTTTNTTASVANNKETGSGGGNKVTFASHPQFKGSSDQVSRGPGVAPSNTATTTPSKTILSKHDTAAVSKASGSAPVKTTVSNTTANQPAAPTASKSVGTRPLPVSASTNSPESSTLNSNVPSLTPSLNQTTTANSRPQNSTESRTRHEQGPQASESTDLWDRNDNTENPDNIDNFINYCVSASSSKTSFGTWHRKRRDQYSAYDFLPEPKLKGS